MDADILKNRDPEYPLRPSASLPWIYLKQQLNPGEERGPRAPESL